MGDILPILPHHTLLRRRHVAALASLAGGGEISAVAAAWRTAFTALLRSRGAKSGGGGIGPACLGGRFIGSRRLWLGMPRLALGGFLVGSGVGLGLLGLILGGHRRRWKSQFQDWENEMVDLRSCEIQSVMLKMLKMQWAVGLMEWVDFRLLWWCAVKVI